MLYRLAWCGSRKYFLIGFLCSLAIIHRIKRSFNDPDYDTSFKVSNEREKFYPLRNHIRDFDKNQIEHKLLEAKRTVIFSEFVEDVMSEHDTTIQKSEVDRASILENSCKFPVLLPDDLSLKPYIKHIRTLECKKVVDELVIFNRSTRILRIDQALLERIYDASVKSNVLCEYQPIDGTLRPSITKIKYNPNAVVSFKDQSPPITDDQIKVNCSIIHRQQNGAQDTYEIYQNAFAQISPKTVENRTLLSNSEEILNIDIIGLDSTALNMFKRHMPLSWRYMTETMGFLQLEAYNKVADNSMVNWVPILLGKRYLNQSNDMLNELQSPGPNKPLELENFDWLWKKFERKGCATMMNDDPMHYTRGLFHYPWEETIGFWTKPTDYYFRPWHVYHRFHGHPNASQFCFRNRPYYELQLSLVEEMIENFHKTCHFSFSFLTDITHDNPNNLELIDDYFVQMLSRLYTRNYLNHTVLLVMGDHGNRIGAIQYSYAGRIEERAAFLSIYFPPWFRQKYSNLMDNFRVNKVRLTSNYDVYQTLQAVLSGKFDADPKPDPSNDKGLSLFSKIPADRTCKQLQVPDNHCLCMTPAATDRAVADDLMVDRIVDLVIEHAVGKLPTTFRRRCAKALDQAITILNISTWTTSQMIQHGVRYPTPEYLKRLQKVLPGELEFFEVNYAVSRIGVLTRFQYNKVKRKLTMNVEPLVLTSNCPNWDDLGSFCACSAY